MRGLRVRVPEPLLPRAPQSTRMSIIKAAGNDMFPSIVICPYPFTNTTLNSTILSECGIHWGDYLKKAKWSNKEIGKCENPKTSFTTSFGSQRI